MKKVKVFFFCEWTGYFDWILIPSIMVAVRDRQFSIKLGRKVTGLGIGLIFLKWKIQLLFVNKRDYETN